jgi:hypothetical protein
LGVFQRWEFKNTTKNRFAKKIMSKSFYKKFDQKSKTDFFSIFVYHVFGRFSVRGVQKHDTKISEKINLTLVLFWPLTHPPTTGVTDFFFIGGPLPTCGGMSTDGPQPTQGAPTKQTKKGSRSVVFLGFFCPLFFLEAP